jgi:hypothetical protein
MLGVHEEDPPGRFIAPPGDEVGALAGHLLAEAQLVTALVLGIRSIEHGHVGLGDGAHLRRLGHRASVSGRVLVVWAAV